MKQNFLVASLSFVDWAATDFFDFYKKRATFCLIRTPKDVSTVSRQKLFVKKSMQ